jgi:rRNA processing protein Krr1/Pno1
VNKDHIAKDHPEVLVRTKRLLRRTAYDLTVAGLKEIDDLIVRLTVDTFVIPKIIGKGGETIKKLTEGKAAFVEVDRNTGEVSYGATTAEVRDELGRDLNELMESNSVLRLKADPATLNSHFREMSRSGLKKQLNDMDVWFSADEEKGCFILRGKKEVLEQGKTTIEDYIAKNYMAELSITDEDRDSLLIGGKGSKISLFAEEFDVKLNIDRAHFVLTVRGTQENVDQAAKKLDQFINGGDGYSVAKLAVNDQVVGVIIGKGGKRRQQLEKKYEGVSITISKSHVVTVRGPDQAVADCRVEIGKMIASARVTQSIPVSSEQKEILEKKDFARKIAQQTSVAMTVDGDKVIAKGFFYDVRDSVSLVNEMLTGEYKTAIELDASQFAKVRNAVRDPTHFERMEEGSGASVQLDLAAGSIAVSGKRTNVKKAKDQIFGFLTFLLPGDFGRLKIAKPLLGSVGQASVLAEISARAGGLAAYLDRDLGEIILRSQDHQKVKLGTELVEEKIKEAERLVYVLEVSASFSWVLAALSGKKGTQLSALTAKYPGCKIEVSRETRTITVVGDSEETVQAVKEAVLAAVEKAMAENVVFFIPEGYVSSFVGRGGSHVKELSAKHGVDIQRIQREHFNFKVCGEVAKVAAAKKDIDDWLVKKEKSSTPLTFTLDRDSDVAVILGSKGAVARSIQEEHSCRVDVDRKSLVVTVRGPSEEQREAAVKEMKALLAKAREEAAARQAAGNGMLEQHDVEPSAAPDGASECQPAPSPTGMPSTADQPSPPAAAAADEDKNNSRGSEYPVQPVGITAPAKNGGEKTKTKKMDPSIDTGTESGRNLYAMLVED